MAQPSKVLHLYVEVRSLAEQGKMLENAEGTSSLMLPRPDILSQSHSAAFNAPQGIVYLPGDLHKETSKTHTFASSKSPSRHSVSVQLNPGEAMVQPAAQHRQSLPYNEISQLLSALKSGSDEDTHTLVQTQLSKCEPFQGRDSRFSGHFTAPPTPSGSRRTYGCKEEGKRSSVTYHYIEKANIKFVQGQHSGLCQSEPGNPFRRAVNDKGFPPNMFSDPVCFNSWGSSDAISKKHTIPGSLRAPRDTPNPHQATIESIAREATSHALEEFGSPQLKHQRAANIPDRGHDPLHRDQPRCNSWSGSPVLPHSARSLPINAQLKYQNQHNTSYGIPRSQATDQLSTHGKQPNCTMSSPTNAQSEQIPIQQVTPSQEMWKEEESPRQSYRPGPFLPTIMSTTIQHEIPAMTQSLGEQRVDQRTSKSPCQTHKVSFHLASTSHPLDGGAGKQSGGKSTSSATSPEMAYKLAEEATKLSRLMEARRSTRLPARLHHVSTSPIQDLQERAALPGEESPVLYQHWPQNDRSPQLEHRYCDAQCSTVLRDSPDSSRRALKGLLTDTPLSSSSLQQCWHEEHSFQVGDFNKEHLCSTGPPSGMSSWELSKWRSSVAVLDSQENHCRMSEQRDMRGEGLADAEKTIALSKSSSRVTGSLREVTQAKIDCNSPETSSQTSQRSSDTGNTGIQLDSGSLLLCPSLHSQKIARAKWEFLFGKPSEDQAIKGENMHDDHPDHSHIWSARREISHKQLCCSFTCLSLHLPLLENKL
ncbi:uncharacterized protein LOC113571538 [Electrophorus electricus]|uniref:uncharacterized protein LOC113571538 n=1 Tax=Electrophorus electricus TaxID=8005 RepID=UPI0015CF9F07|nr:uncharacterized protein LOC113571538 [Electrophorus electricus]